MIIDPRLYQQSTLLPVESSHTAIGVMGELLIAKLLCEAGYRILQSHKRGDLTVADCNGVITNIEVKTARVDKHGRWQFCLRKKGHTDCSVTDLVVFLLVQSTGRPIPFVVPSIELKAKCVAFSSPSRYAGRLAKYRTTLKRLHLSMEIEQ
jgi:hypothetical protein